MELEMIEAETGSQPRACIVVLHGLGADGSDFVPIAEQLALDEVGPVRFLFPHAPVQPVTINGGYPMRAWYDILEMGVARPREDEAGLRASAAAIGALIEHEVGRGIPSERIVLAGFSQGCAMALLAGLRHPRRLAGLVGLSGYLPLADTTPAEQSAANAAVPIFLAHGVHDDIVVVQRGRASRDALVALGRRVEWHEYPMTHAVCPQEVEDLQDFLLRVLA